MADYTAWYCHCGWSTTDAFAAFLHRGVDHQHHIRPLTEGEALAQHLEPPFDGSGVAKHFAMQEAHRG